MFFLFYLYKNIFFSPSMLITFDEALEIIKENQFLDSIFTVELLYGQNTFETVSMPFCLINACFNREELKDISDYLNKKLDSISGYTGIRICIFVKEGIHRQVTRLRQQMTAIDIQKLEKTQFIEQILVTNLKELLAKLIE